MMTNESASPQHCHQEKTPPQILAKQFNMTVDEAKMILRIIHKNDIDLESLKLPKIQEIITHRKGRWIQEEENFATFLCEEFRLGLSKLDNGVTKRSYLSSKLHCTKMRISKKFKGKNPGKDVFLQQDKIKDGPVFSPKELYYYEQRHEELEKRFLMAVLKTTLKSGMRNAQKKLLEPSLSSSTVPAKQSSTNRVNLQATAPCSLPVNQSATMPMNMPTTAMKLPGTPFEGSSSGDSPTNNMNWEEFPAPNIAMPPCSHPVEQTNNNAMQHTAMPNIGFTQNPATQIAMPQNVPGPAPLIQDSQLHPGFFPLSGVPGTSSTTSNTSGQMMTISSVVNRPTSVTTLPSSTSSTPPQAVTGQGAFDHNQYLKHLQSSVVQSECSQQASPTSTLMSSTTIGLNHGPTIFGMQPLTIPLHGTQPSGLGVQAPSSSQSYPNTLIKMQIPMYEKIQRNGQFSVDRSNITAIQGKGNASDCIPNSLAHDTAQTFGSNSSSSYAGMKNNQYTLSNGPEDSKKRAGTEIVGLLGFDFATSLDSCGNKRFKSIPNAAASHAVSTSASEPSSNDESSFSHGISKRKDMTSKNTCVDNDIPDILSGFDQHVATMKSGATIPEDSHFFAGAGGVAESPYITSKSFDELHQFLGKGLSSDKMPPLDLNQSVANYQPVSHHTGTCSLATANPTSGRPNRGAFIPVVPRGPNCFNPQPYLSVCNQSERPSSVSNSSELTYSSG